MSNRDGYCLAVINLIRAAMRQGYEVRLHTRNSLTTAKLFFGIRRVGQCSRPGLRLQTTIRRAMVAARVAGWPLYIPEQHRSEETNE